MFAATWVIVVWGVAAAVLLGLGMALDMTALLMLAFILFFGGIGIAVATKTRKHQVSPALCSECGGLLSPNAPYCKHCGARLDDA